MLTSPAGSIKMSTHPRDVIAVAHQTLALDEAALKQVAVLFNRIAYPGLTALRSIPHTQQLAPHLLTLADTGIVFEPEIQKSDDEDFKSRLEEDLGEIFKPYGVSGEEVLASRKDEQKALEFRQKTQAIDPESPPASLDPVAMFSAVQRMTVNMTRLAAVQMRTLNNLDAQAVIPSEFSSFEQEEDQPNKHDVLKIIVPALPLPERHVSWEKIIEYRSDPNSLNRFPDLRNWILDTGRGKLTGPEVEERFHAVLMRFRKQMEIHGMKTVTMMLEAFVTTSPDVIRGLLSYQASRAPNLLCFFEHRKLALLEGEAQSEVSEVGYVLETSFLADSLNG